MFTLRGGIGGGGVYLKAVRLRRGATITDMMLRRERLGKRIKGLGSDRLCPLL